MNKVFLGLLIFSAILLAGCTNPTICGDNICAIGENLPNSPNYCPQDCGGTTTTGDLRVIVYGQGNQLAADQFTAPSDIIFRDNGVEMAQHVSLTQLLIKNNDPQTAMAAVSFPSNPGEPQPPSTLMAIGDSLTVLGVNEWNGLKFRVWFNGVAQVGEVWVANFSLHKDSQPVEGAIVNVQNESNGPNYEQTTGADGSTFFKQLSPGEYAVKVRADGFEIYSQSGVKVFQNEVTKHNVTLIPDGSTNINATVKVMDDGGFALAQADVAMTLDGSPTGQAMQTDGTGHAFFLDIAAGHYTVNVSKDGFESQTLGFDVSSEHINELTVQMQTETASLCFPTPASQGFGRMLNSTTSGVEFFQEQANLPIDPQCLPWNAVINGNTFDLNPTHGFRVTSNAKFDALTTNVKDLVTVINPSDVYYQVNFQNPIPYPFSDTGSDDYVPIPLVNKKYLLESINASATNMVLATEGSERIFSEGDLFSVAGVNGQPYSILFNSGSDAGETLIANISLLNENGMVLKSDQFSAPSDIIFRQNGQPLLLNPPRLLDITTVNQNGQTVYSFNVISGQDRIELQSGREFPYDPNANGSNIPWIVSFTTSGSNLTGIRITNSNAFFSSSNPLYSPGSFFANAENTTPLKFWDASHELFAQIAFDGFEPANQTIPPHAGIVFNGGSASGTSGTTHGSIKYTDDGGFTHIIPMAIQLPATSATGSILTFDETTNQAYKTDSQTSIIEFCVENDSASLPISTCDYEVSVLTADNSWNGDSMVKLKGKNGKYYRYLVKRSATNESMVYLVLAGYAQDDQTNFSGYIDTLANNAGALFLVGTAINDASIVTNHGEYKEKSSSSTGNNRPYYYPDLFDYSGTQSGTTTGIYRTAIFRIAEGTDSSTMPVLNANNTAYVFVDTEAGSNGTIDTFAIGNGTKANWSGTLANTPAGVSSLNSAIIYVSPTQNLIHLSEYNCLPGQSSGNYCKAFTDYGTKIGLELRMLSFSIPAEQAPVALRVQMGTGTALLDNCTDPASGLDIVNQKLTNAGWSLNVNNISGRALSSFSFPEIVDHSLGITIGNYTVNPQPLSPGLAATISATGASGYVTGTVHTTDFTASYFDGDFTRTVSWSCNGTV